MEIKNKVDAISILRAVTKLNSYGIGEFNIGDIVLDKLNQEYGIIISLKPVPIRDEMTLKKFRNIANKPEIAYYADNELRTGIDKSGIFVLLTLSKAPSDNNFCEKGTPIFRVRYVGSRNIEKIQIPDNKKNTSTDSDLEYHCQNECLLKCTKECSLWKFRKRK